jgi:hypothetical protein
MILEDDDIKHEVIESYETERTECIIDTSEDIKHHLKTFHSDVIEIHPCDYPSCEKNFRTRMKLLQHKKTHEIGKFPCNYGPKHFTTKQYV